MLLDELKSKFISKGLTPVDELVDYVEECDRYINDEISLADLQIAMLLYLDKLALRNQALSLMINRSREPQIGDHFTEALNLAFQSITKNSLFKGLDFNVSSEHNFYLYDNRYLKPDVAGFIGAKPIFMLECKSNLGYDRQNWMDNYIKRQSALAKSGLNPNLYFLCVLTDSNWNGFSTLDPRTNKQWHTFTKKGSWYGGKNRTKRLTDGSNCNALENIVETLITYL